MANIKILATGGTIAGKGLSASQMKGYAPGAIGIEVLLDNAAEIRNVANVSAEQITNIASSSITHNFWVMLSKRIEELLAKEEVDGVVITHGTSTLEETAYFLNLVIRSEKPVVLVGAMRPATAISADGPLNLLNAVKLAATPESRGKGVLVVLNNQINSARDVTKTNTSQVETFQSRDFGLLGYMDNGKAYFFRDNLRKHTYKSEFNTSLLIEFPRVDIIYGHVNGDRVFVEAAVNAGARGIVYAAMGPNSICPDTKEALVESYKKRAVVIVKSARLGSGIITRIPEDDETHFIAGNTLNPQKARILLMLSLIKTSNLDEIQQFFDEY